MEEAYNFKAILVWCEKHRRDLVPQFERMLEMDQQGLSNNTLQGLMMVAAVGFEAGREFQAKNPELDVNEKPMAPFDGVNF